MEPSRSLLGRRLYPLQARNLPQSRVKRFRESLGNLMILKVYLLSKIFSIDLTATILMFAEMLLISRLTSEVNIL